MARSYSLTVHSEALELLERSRVALARLAGNTEILTKKATLPVALRIATEELERRVAAQEATVKA